MHSHHSHSALFCSHAHPGSTPEVMLARATALGFHTYCLSEHVPRQEDGELYPEEVEGGETPQKLMEKWQSYLKEARRVQRLYNGQGSGQKRPRVLVGAETENISPGTVKFLRETVFSSDEQGAAGPSSSIASGGAIGKGVVDYLVGSVHHAGGITLPCQCASSPAGPSPRGIPIDFDNKTFDEAIRHFALPEDGQDTLSAQLRLSLAYFEAQYQLLDSLRPEVIGHFDLCRMFIPDVRLFSEEDLRDLSSEPASASAPASAPASTSASTSTALRQAVSRACDRNIRLGVSYGALFEINTASLRKGWATPYPGADVLRRIHALGGRCCLSDDAHGPSHVAISYSAAREYLVEMGISSIWVLELDSESKEAGADKSDQGPPVVFPRGTRAREVKQWDQDDFWKNLEATKAQCDG